MLVLLGARVGSQPFFQSFPVRIVVFVVSIYFHPEYPTAWI